jgi:DASS family divalent anion:Na+ symporter
MIMNLAQIIDNTPYLNIMHPTHRSEVVSGSEKIIMVKDSVVFTEDAKGDFVYFIANGEIVLSNSNGQVIKKAGESFGEEIYLGSDRYLSTAKAIEDTTIYLVPKSALMPSNLQESRIANGLFTSFIKQYLKIPIMFGSSSVTTGNTTSSWSDVFGWFFTLIIPVITYYALAGSQITEESRLFLSFLGCSISMWMFRLFPEFIPGLFLLMATLMFGVAPTSVVLSGLSSETFLLIMSVFVISLLITTSGLTHRFAFYLTNMVSKSMLGLNIVIFLIGTILTPMVPSIVSRCVLVTPLVSKMVHNLNISNKSFLSVQFAASAFFGCSIFANVILSSSLMNFVILGLLPVQEQDQFQWFGWLKAAGVYGIAVAIGYFSFMFVTMLMSKKKEVRRSIFKEQLQALGGWRREEITGIIGITVLTIGLLTNSIHKIHPSIVTMFVMFCIFGFGFISKNQFQKEVDWPFLIFMASAVSITATIKYLGMDIWLSQYLKILTSSSNSATMFLTYICVVTLITRIFLPIAPSIVLLSTTFIPLAPIEGVNPWLVTFIILVAADMWFIPYQNSFYIIFRGSGTFK